MEGYKPKEFYLVIARYELEKIAKDLKKKRISGTSATCIIRLQEAEEKNYEGQLRIKEIDM